ncbi:uncharacterized protein Gasu_33330 [Galdieria sulphuraria]|uniref:FMP27/BLTP2/Hobbit GFWDK motif-containing RBG unit domain-containing protein n=1 Tax=Galdieria sulphuraria TaxID=130081 RepID=M2XGY5_GALSU|nr:uncharacterized protein Gasu_33330 [Galdieria sulphuraria]EME29327.1 hypothetical protein Gasu_33330 [Galdieria sulphuraria]|eukprot:XP_005705847.1 hypothetical protein Gasu_33330 [Galdieria sulphuraria]
MLGAHVLKIPFDLSGISIRKALSLYELQFENKYVNIRVAKFGLETHLWRSIASRRRTALFDIYISGAEVVLKETGGLSKTAGSNFDLLKTSNYLFRIVQELGSSWSKFLFVCCIRLLFLLSISFDNCTLAMKHEDKLQRFISLNSHLEGTDTVDYNCFTWKLGTFKLFMDTTLPVQVKHTVIILKVENTYLTCSVSLQNIWTERLSDLQKLDVEIRIPTGRGAYEKAQFSLFVDTPSFLLHPEHLLCFLKPREQGDTTLSERRTTMDSHTLEILRLWDFKVGMVNLSCVFPDVILDSMHTDILCRLSLGQLKFLLQDAACSNTYRMKVELNELYLSDSRDNFDDVRKYLTSLQKQLATTKNCGLRTESQLLYKHCHSFDWHIESLVVCLDVDMSHIYSQLEISNPVLLAEPVKLVRLLDRTHSRYQVFIHFLKTVISKRQKNHETPETGLSCKGYSWQVSGEVMSGYLCFHFGFPQGEEAIQAYICSVPLISMAKNSLTASSLNVYQIQTEDTESIFSISKVKYFPAPECGMKLSKVLLKWSPDTHSCAESAIEYVTNALRSCSFGWNKVQPRQEAGLKTSKLKLTISEVEISASFPDDPQTQITIDELSEIHIDSGMLQLSKLTWKIQNHIVLFISLATFHFSSHDFFSVPLGIYCRRVIFCLPYDLHFGNSWMEFFWRMKGYLLRKKRYMSALGRSSFPDMNISIDDCSAIFEDHPWESYLMKHRPVIKDETVEQINRRHVLRRILEQLPAAERNAYEAQCYSKLDEENATLYAYRVREVQRYWQLDRFDLSGIDARLPPLLLANIKNCSISIRKTTVDHNIDANMEMLNELYKLDECRDIPNSAQNPSMYKDFGIRRVEFVSSYFSFHLRDYPYSIATVKSLSFSGKVGAMEQATREPFIRHMFVALGSKLFAELNKQISPLKIFLDGKLTLEDVEGVFGVGMLPSFEDLSQCFLRLSPDRSDPSPRLAWWDQARLIFHGRIEVVVRKLKYDVLTSTFCYSYLSYHTVEADELNACFTRCATDKPCPWLSVQMKCFSISACYFGTSLGSFVKLDQVKVNISSILQTESGNPDNHYIHPFAERSEVPFVAETCRMPNRGELFRKLACSRPTCQLKNVPNHDTYGGFRISSLFLKIEIFCIPSHNLKSCLIHSDDIASTLQCIVAIRNSIFQCIPIRKKFGHSRKAEPAGFLEEIMKTFKLYLSSQDMHFTIINDLNPGHSLLVETSDINFSLTKRRDGVNTPNALNAMRLLVKNLDIRMRSPSLDQAAKREEEEPSRGSFFVHIPMFLVLLESEVDSCLRTSSRIISMENLTRLSSSSLGSFSVGSGYNSADNEILRRIVFGGDSSEDEDNIECNFNNESSGETLSHLQRLSLKEQGFSNQILAFDARILWTVERRDSLSEWPRAIFLNSHKKGVKTLDKIRKHQRISSAELDRITEGNRNASSNKDALLSLLSENIPETQDSNSTSSLKRKQLEIIASYPQLQLSLIRPVVALCSPETEGVCKLVASYGYLTLVHQQVKEDDIWKRLELHAGMEDTVMFTLPKGISFDLDSIGVTFDSSSNLRVTNSPFERISGPPILVEVVYTSPMSDEVDMDSFRPKAITVKVADLTLSLNSPQFFIFLTVITNFLVKPFQQTIRLQEELAVLTHTIHLIKQGHLSHLDAKHYTKQIVDMVDLIDKHRSRSQSDKARKFFNLLGSQDTCATRRELIDKASALLAYTLQKQQSESDQGWMPKFYLDVCIKKCKLFLKTSDSDETDFAEATIDRFQVKQTSTLDGGTKIEYSVKDVKMKNVCTENAAFKTALAVSKKQIDISKKEHCTENVFTIDGDPVAFRWFTIQSPPVGRIHVVDVLTVGVAPLEIALTRHISEELYQFFMRKSLNETEEEEERLDIKENNLKGSSQTVRKVSSFLKSEVFLHEGSSDLHSMAAKLRSVIRGVEDFTKDSGLSSFIQGKWTNLRRTSPEIQHDTCISDKLTFSEAKNEDDASKKQLLTKKRIPVDDLSCMRQREQNNILFKYVYVGQVSWTVSFKYKDSGEEKSILDFEKIRISLPSLMYHSHTWSWTDLFDQLRRDVQSRVLGQALSRLARRKLLGVRELGQKLWREAKSPDAIRILSQAFGKTEEELVKEVENLDWSESENEDNDEGQASSSSESATVQSFSQGKENLQGRLKNERDLERKRQVFLQVIYGIHPNSFM